MNKNSAGAVPLALIIIVVAVLAGGGYFLVKVRPGKSTLKPTPAPTEEIEEFIEETPKEEPTEKPTSKDEEKSDEVESKDKEKKDNKDEETSTTKDSEENDENGKIEGSLGYPSEGIPPLEVYAISQTTGKYYFVKTFTNQAKFEIKDVEPGTYVVVAYAANLAGGYTNAVPCGLSVDCKDHTLIPVVVKSGETSGGVEVKDWYAQEKDFPKKPK